MELKKRIGLALKHCRTGRENEGFEKLSQKDVAEAAGISTRYYNMIENATTNKIPTLGVIEKLADVFDISFVDLCKMIAANDYNEE